MGMYTELVMACELPETTPPNIIETIRFMLGDKDSPPEPIEDHPLFQTKRWESMLVSSSYYFINSHGQSSLQYDDISKSYILTVWCNLKNYDDEIAKFLAWINKYSRSCGFVGYMRYEEFDNPTLIYFENDGVEYKKVCD